MSDHPVIDSLEANRPAHGGRRLSFGGSAVLDQVLREANVQSNDTPKDSTDSSPTSTSPTATSTATSSSSSPKASPVTPHPHTTIPPVSSSASSSTESKLAATTTTTTPATQVKRAITPPRIGPAALTGEGWQPLQSKSSNHVHPTQRSAAAEQLADDLREEWMKHEHDKPSVLPILAPGFQERLADVHHASLKSVADVQPSTTTSNGAATEAGGAGQQQQQASAWTGGTMFPVMPGGFKPVHGVVGGAPHPASHHPRHLSKSSILYESADVPIPGEDDMMTGAISPPSLYPPSVAQQHHQHQQLHQQQQQSSTLVQGGSGDRRWSHELSPEKAGLVGSVLEAAGLIKDVVLDKITHHGPGSTIESSKDSSILFGEESAATAAASPKKDAGGGGASTRTSTHTRRHSHELTDQDKQTAARAAFGGGSDETGDQNVYYSGLKTSTSPPTNHSSNNNHNNGASSKPTATATAPGYGVQDLLASAPQAGQAHRRSMLLHEAASNPEVYKGLLLNHPEKLGYHSRDPDWVGPVASEDPVLARLGVNMAGHPVTTTPVAGGTGGTGVMTNADQRREQQK
ncbi:hypothetical protein BGW42_001419 [Actinomortierella wolfii]|nr:hypothetical protein BGW42_001419 [Actinomortierella wolfii]